MRGVVGWGTTRFGESCSSALPQTKMTAPAVVSIMFLTTSFELGKEKDEKAKRKQKTETSSNGTQFVHR